MEEWLRTDAGSVPSFKVHIQVMSPSGLPIGIACCPASEQSRGECLDDIATLLFRWSLRFKTKELAAVGEASVEDVMTTLRHMKASRNEESPSEEEDTPQSAKTQYGPFSNMPYATLDLDVLSQRSGKGSSRRGRFSRGNRGADPRPDRSSAGHPPNDDEEIWRTRRVARLMAEHLHAQSHGRASDVLPPVAGRVLSDPLCSQPMHDRVDGELRPVPRGFTSET
eukprot:TRINITY_DN13280_c1_g2_i1.p1 TRINITY_DN13280_c1_g2~~TRINITY_DN13280_c1_g2_i1.p1  ORF type:complete len:224 (-),score=16.15 TRINITY_DN13280_c1_g2_i1:264-935(-)